MDKINVSNLAKEVMQELEIYKQNTVENVESAVIETAKEAVAELKKKSPKGITKDYAKSWKYKRNKETKKAGRYSVIVYSKDPEYRLTHLLEYGHANRDGGRTEGNPHISTVEKNAKQVLQYKIQKKLENY